MQPYFKMNKHTTVENVKATHSGVTEVCGSYESWRNGAKPFETSHVLERGDDIHHMKPHEKLSCVLRVLDAFVIFFLV